MFGGALAFMQMHEVERGFFFWSALFVIRFQTAVLSDGIALGRELCEGVVTDASMVDVRL